MVKLSVLIVGFGLALSSACGGDAGKAHSSSGSDAGAGGDGDDDDSCTATDQDGIVGGNNVVLLSVSDTGFAVGGVNSGSTQRNIAVQNSAHVKLTITNTGTVPHGFQVACITANLPAPCPAMSCFPDAAGVPSIDPGASVTVEFNTPVVEGAYPFTSPEPGDDALVGQFVLM